MWVCYTTHGFNIYFDIPSTPGPACQERFCEIFLPLSHFAPTISAKTDTERAQIECNAPLNAIVTRVERATAHTANSTLNSSIMSAEENNSPTKMDVCRTPDRIFTPLPRAHETAVAERERTLLRMAEKQAKLDDFLQQTKTRVMASEDMGRAVAKAEARIVQDQTRRRIDQVSGLIPKPTAGATRREGGERPRGKGWRRGAGVRSAKDVAAELGSEVVSELSETMVCAPFHSDMRDLCLTRPFADGEAFAAVPQERGHCGWWCERGDDTDQTAARYFSCDGYQPASRREGGDLQGPASDAARSEQGRSVGGGEEAGHA